VFQVRCSKGNARAKEEKKPVKRKKKEICRAFEKKKKTKDSPTPGVQGLCDPFCPDELR